jgi:hypothetical protein
VEGRRGAGAARGRGWGEARLNKAGGGGGYGGAAAVRCGAWMAPQPSMLDFDRIHADVGLTRPLRATRKSRF